MDQPNPRVFFVLGCGRSGTTSLARLLDGASNGVCLNEPDPVLARESRLLAEGRLRDPFGVLAREMLPRIVAVLDRDLIYGEKNLTLGPFVPYLAGMLRCRFLFVLKDGRDVVRSWLDWHNMLYANLYRECREAGKLTRRAREWAAQHPVPTDIRDAGRLRPMPGDPWHAVWHQLTRLEMAAWYWARTNDLIMDQLEQLPSEQWRLLDYSAIRGDDILGAAKFLGLSGLDPVDVDRRLGSRINALAEHADESQRHPAWSDWAEDDKIAFDAMAWDAMRRFGYYSADCRRGIHIGFAKAWEKQPAEFSDDADLRWLMERAGTVESVLALSQGADDAARSAFPGAKFTGIDLSPTLAEAAGGEAAGWHAENWLLDQGNHKAELALVRAGVLRRVADIDATVTAVAAAAKRFAFLSFLREGEDLSSHRHYWRRDRKEYDNLVSLAAVARRLVALGFTVIETGVVGEAGARRACLLARHGLSQ